MWDHPGPSGPRRALRRWWTTSPEWAQSSARAPARRPHPTARIRIRSGTPPPVPRASATSVAASIAADPHGRFRRTRRGRARVLVNLLAFVVVVRVQLPVGPGDRLSRLVSLEAHVKGLFLGRLRGITQALIAQHQVVVRLEILRIDH